MIPMPGTSKIDWLTAMQFVYPVVPAPYITWGNSEVRLQAAADSAAAACWMHQLHRELHPLVYSIPYKLHQMSLMKFVLGHQCPAPDLKKCSVWPAGGFEAVHMIERWTMQHSTCMNRLVQTGAPVAN
jgi:hypothetical protein